jgi:TIR domain
MESALEVFFSYAHADEEWKNRLIVSLSMLKRGNLISEWHDRNITPGAEWATEIDTHLLSAHIILLLVSPDFLASNYCWGIEVKTAMQRHDAREACVIPIIIRPADWKYAPFSKLQALPTDGKPVTTWLDKDEAFLNITKGIRAAIQSMKKAEEGKASNSVPSSLPLSSDISALLTTNQSTDRNNDALVDRNDLLDTLSACPPGIFSKVVAYCNLPDGVLSSERTSQSERASELIKWAEQSDEPNLKDVNHYYLRAKAGKKK